MNGVEENLLYLQSVNNRILKKEVFLECKGLRIYENELERGRRGGKIGLWLEYISRVKNNILMIKDGSYHEMEYMSEADDLNKEIGLDNIELDEVERQGLDGLVVNLLYKYDYCLIIVRRALNWSSHRDVSIWKEYLELLEDYELFIENKLGKGLINLDIVDEYESCLRSCNEVDLWLGYSRYLLNRKTELTRSRHVLDRSLRSLPLQTHHKIWNQYLEYIYNVDIPILSISVLRRFLLFSFKDGIEPYIQALIRGEKLVDCLNELFGLIRRRKELDYSLFKNGIEINGSRHKVSGMDDLFNLALVVISENVLGLDVNVIEEYTRKLMDEKLGENREGNAPVFSPVLEGGANLDVGESSASQTETVSGGNRGYRLTFGELVCRVSQIYMKLADWKKVYEIYYFGIERCKSVYDFTVIYDSMMMFSSIYMNRLLNNTRDSVGGDSLYLSQSRSSLSHPSLISSLKDLSEEPLRNEFERLEKIVTDHNCLLYKTLVRCDRDNVARWIEYISAFIKEEKRKNRPEPSIEVVKVFEEAIDTINFCKIKDKSRCVFWVFYANYMTSSVDNGNEILGNSKNRNLDKERELLDLSREVFERALTQTYIEDYTLLWTEWVEMELRFGNSEYALNLVRRCLGLIKEQKDSKKTMNNPKIWQLSSDIEISFGTPESVWSLIEELFSSGMPTCSLIISFGDYFKRKGLYGDAFTLYERAISALEMPFSFNVCLDLINTFVSHYSNITVSNLFDLEDGSLKEGEEGGSDNHACNNNVNSTNSRIERLREILEYSLSALGEWKKKLRVKELDCYYEYVFILYSIYGVCEARIGRKKRAYDVFGRAVRQLDEQDKYKVIVYTRWINLTLKCSDVAYTRSIFDSAIEDLKTPDAIIRICLKYANFELNMGEINRVRSIFVYSSELVPRIYLQERHFSLYNKFWTSWSYFEREYGNEDTLKDLLTAQKNVPLVSGHSVYTGSSAASSSSVSLYTSISGCSASTKADDKDSERAKNDGGGGREGGEMVVGIGERIPGIGAMMREGKEPLGILDSADFKNCQYGNEDEEQASDQEYDTSNTFVDTDSDDDLLLSLSSSENSEDESESNVGQLNRNSLDGNSPDRGYNSHPSHYPNAVISDASVQGSSVTHVDVQATSSSTGNDNRDHGSDEDTVTQDL